MAVTLSSVSVYSLVFILLTPELENSILTSSGCNERLEGNERDVMGADLLDQNCFTAGRGRQDSCEMRVR